MTDIHKGELPGLSAGGVATSLDELFAFARAAHKVTAQDGSESGPSPDSHEYTWHPEPGTLVYQNPDLKDFSPANPDGTLKQGPAATKDIIKPENVAAIVAGRGNGQVPDFVVYYKDGSTSQLYPGDIEQGAIGSVDKENATEYINADGTEWSSGKPERSSNFFGRLWGGVQDAAGENTMKIVIPAAAAAAMAYSGYLVGAAALAGGGGAAGGDAATTGGLTALETAELGGLGLSTTGTGGSLTASEIATLEAAGVSTAGIIPGTTIAPEVAQTTATNLTNSLTKAGKSVGEWVAKNPKLAASLGLTAAGLITGGGGGGGTNTTTTTTTTNPDGAGATAGMNTIAERQMAMAEDQWQMYKDYFQIYEVEAAKANRELLPYITSAAKEQLSLKEAQAKAEKPVSEKFYKEALEGVNVNERMDEAGAEVVNSMRLGESARRREASRYGLDPGSTTFGNAMNTAALETAKGVAGARTTAKNQAETENFQRLGLAIGKAPTSVSTVNNADPYARASQTYSGAAATYAPLATRVVQSTTEKPTAGFSDFAGQVLGYGLGSWLGG